MNERRAVFLERRSYRSRRLIDLVRILPLIGGGLWALPLLWRRDGEAAMSTATAMIYLFAVWFVLVVATGFLSFLVRRHQVDEVAEQG